jgi:hypothetical protein
VIVVRTSDAQHDERMERTVAGAELDVDSLQFGSYAWTVHVDDEWRTPLFLRARTFTLAHATVRTPSTIKEWGQH